jgi:hypothetical protein
MIPSVQPTPGPERYFIFLLYFVFELVERKNEIGLKSGSAYVV